MEITNLIASVVITLATNVSESKLVIGHGPGHGGTPDCPTCLVWNEGPPIYSESDKTRTTSVVRTSTIEFDWMGKRRSVSEVETLSSDTIALHKTDVWNSLTNIAFLTNGVIGTVTNAPHLSPFAQKIKDRDGTNFIGVFMGMIAEWDGYTNEFNAQGTRKPGPPYQGVMMFSETSGEMLKWISYDDFRDIFVLKKKPEYTK